MKCFYSFEPAASNWRGCAVKMRELPHKSGLIKTTDLWSFKWFQSWHLMLRSRLQAICNMTWGERHSTAPHPSNERAGVSTGSFSGTKWKKLKNKTDFCVRRKSVFNCDGWRFYQSESTLGPEPTGLYMWPNISVEDHKEDTGWKKETNVVDTMWLKVVIFIMANTLAIIKEQENKSNNLAFK